MNHLQDKWFPLTTGMISHLGEKVAHGLQENTTISFGLGFKQVIVLLGKCEIGEWACSFCRELQQHTEASECF